ncbi:hypothetical protein [Niabella beijingensis]|nr:hypothetical protein [Niabella beijingensis]
MSKGLDPGQVREYYQQLDNHELMRIALHDAAGLTPEAQEIVNQEIEKRNLGTAAADAVRVQNKTHSLEEIDAYCALARHLNCPQCGSAAVPLNGALISSTISVLIVTIQNKKLKIACPGCLDRANGNAITTTLLLGWWGIPWGPIRTIQSLGHNNKSKTTNHEEGPNDYLRNFVMANIGAFEMYKNNKAQLQQLISVALE